MNFFSENLIKICTNAHQIAPFKKIVTHIAENIVQGAQSMEHNDTDSGTDTDKYLF